MVPVDKSSTVLTILLALIFLGEGISLPKAAAVAAIAAGIFLMVEKKDVTDTEKSGKKSWLLYAAGSALFASLTSILGKMRGAGDGVGHGLCDGKAERGSPDPEAGAALHLSFGSGHRGFLALLLPGAPGRARQRGGAHR